MPSHKRAEASEVSAAWVRWRGPIFYPSGYGDETRNIALGLERLGVRVAARHVGPFSSIFRRQLDPEKCARLEALIARETTPGHIGVSAFPADAFELEAGVGRHVGRTMFETDGLPNHWVEKCNLMDEIWVPTDFNLETFARAGVKTRLEKVPHGVDSRLFRPGAEPLPIAGARGRVFLSIFEWGFRKGWDVLLDSWSRAFHRDDDVTLVLRTFIHPADSYSGDEIERRIDAYLASRLLSREAVAPIVVLGNQIPEDELPSLYASAAAYVGPSRGEGWGRPYMEAMACGVPVIATRWSGCTEFLDDSNALLIDIEGLEPIDERTEIPSHVGHRWAIPSREHLVDLLRSARRPDLVDPLARRAREDVVARWSWEQAAAVVARRLEALRDDVVTARARPVRVSWLSPDEKYRALHIVDAELRSRLAIDPRFVLDPDASGPGAPAIAVQHQWPPPLEPPEHGRWVVILHWDYGSLPVEWLEAWRGRVDEFWVPSQYVASGLVDDGIPRRSRGRGSVGGEPTLPPRSREARARDEEDVQAPVRRSDGLAQGHRHPDDQLSEGVSQQRRRVPGRQGRAAGQRPRGDDARGVDPALPEATGRAADRVTSIAPSATTRWPASTPPAIAWYSRSARRGSACRSPRPWRASCP